MHGPENVKFDDMYSELLTATFEKLENVKKFLKDLENYLLDLRTARHSLPDPQLTL